MSEVFKEESLPFEQGKTGPVIATLSTAVATLRAECPMLCQKMCPTRSWVTPHQMNLGVFQVKTFGCGWNRQCVELVWRQKILEARDTSLPHIERIWLFTQKALLSCPLYKKSATLNSFLPRAIILCNTLPFDVQPSKFLGMFKSKLKSHLSLSICYTLFPINPYQLPLYLYLTSTPIQSSTYRSAA